jgi:hypothetical protein
LEERLYLENWIEFRSPDNNLHFTKSRIFADTELLKWG